LQVQLTVEIDAPLLLPESGLLTFLQELWEMLSSASENPSGIPQSILDEKAEEIRAKKERQNEINVRPAFLLRSPGPCLRLVVV
jgi:hypothetical protein